MSKRGLAPFGGLPSIAENKRSLSRVKYRTSQTGFSLLELVISASIIALISAIVLVRFTSFDSTIMLKNLAYEVAASIRDAQVYSISVVAGNSNYDSPYGVSFAPNEKNYTFFREASGDTLAYYDTPTTEKINTFTIGRSMQVYDVCVSNGGPENCDVNQLDISFKRPEFKAYFKTTGGTVTNNIVQATIKLNSVNTPGEIWEVRVMKLGQISVVKP